MSPLSRLACCLLLLTPAGSQTLPSVSEKILPVEIEAARRLSAPIELEPLSRRVDFDSKGTAQTVYENVGREFGLNVLFDSDFSPAKEIRFRFEHAGFADAIYALNDVANAFIVPVHSKLFLVAADTQQKRAELEPMITVMQPIPDPLTPEEATQIGQAVQQILEIKRLSVDVNRRVVLLRDTVTKVRVAQELYEHLSKPRAEVVIEVELFSVADFRQVDLGIGLPTDFPAQYLGTALRNVPGTPGMALLALGGGNSLFGVAVGSASLVARKMTSYGRSLSRFQVRSANGLPAEMHIGERYPIVNASFSPIVINDEIQDSIDDGTFREPFPSFTFEDLGLIFKVTPQVHNAQEITLEVEAEFRALSGATVNDIPVISNREVHTQVRLRQGEVTVISGIQVWEDQQSRSGVALLSEIPVLGHLFSKSTRRKNRVDLLITLRPHLVRLPPAEVEPSVTLLYGPEMRPKLPL